MAESGQFSDQQQDEFIITNAVESAENTEKDVNGNFKNGEDGVAARAQSAENLALAQVQLWDTIGEAEEDKEDEEEKKEEDNKPEGGEPP